MKTGADAMLETLLENGIDTIFGYPGGAIMPLYDKIEKFTGIRHILVRNEQGAAFAAQGISRSSQKLGVAIATSGPGATNLITGIMDAYMDSIPSLFITGQVAYPLMGNDVFQEVDIIGATMSCVKHSFVITTVSSIPGIVNEAIKIAQSGRPGPVLVDFPKDISLAEFTTASQITALYHPCIKIPELDQEKITEVFSLLAESKQPILLVGQGVKFSGAEKELLTFVNTLGIPVVSTLLAKGVLREDNENYLGMLGMHGFYDANLAMHHADLIINIGSRFDDRIVGNYDDFAKNSAVIHVDIDASELGKIVKTDVAIHSDAKCFLQECLAYDLQKLDIQAWRESISDWGTQHPFEQETAHFSTKNALNIINSHTSKKLDNYIFSTDVGQHQMWASQIIKVYSPQSWLTSGGAGTMGFGLPTAIGAAIANPGKTVIVIVGDGGIQMNIQELQLLAEHSLNIKVIIMNNNFLGMVRQWQELFFDKNYASTPISSPNYKKLAEAYNITGYSCETPELFSQALSNELPVNGPSVIEVKNISDEENVFPMVAPGKTLGDTMWEA